MPSEYWEPISFGPHQIVGHDLIYVPRGDGPPERLDLVGGRASVEASKARTVANEESSWAVVGLAAGLISTVVGILTGAFRSTPVSVSVTVVLASGRVLRIQAPGGLHRRAKRFAAALNDAASV